MRFLVDECTGPAVASWLHGNGDEVCSVFEEARGMNDDDIIHKAAAENWILIANDKDFGDKAHIFLFDFINLINQSIQSTI